MVWCAACAICSACSACLLCWPPPGAYSAGVTGIALTVGATAY